MLLRRFATSFLFFAIAGSVVTMAPLDASGLKEAQAAVSIEVPLTSLAKRASRIIVGTPQESQSLWEDSGEQGRRIVTYHRVRVSNVVAGTAPQEVWVRTLGGHVGEIGQRVEGAAVLRLHKPVLLFLAERLDGTHSVLEMAQGAYPIERTEGGEERVGAPVAPGVVLQRKTEQSARTLLVGQRLSDAIALIVAARSSNAK